MTRVDTEILIAGGGLAGATLAGLLGCRSVDCTVIDPGTGPREIITDDPRALAITIASANILKDFGVWEKLPENRIGYFRHMLVWDGNGKGRISFDCAEVNQSTLGYIVEQTILQHALEDAMKYYPAISLIRGQTIETLEWQTDCIRAILSDGSTVTTKLVVAADGVNSSTRGLAGIEYNIHDYHQSAVACLVETEFPHEDVARQRFLKTGPLAFLPMANENQCGIVWSTLPDHAQSLMDMEEGEFDVTLRDAFDNTLGRIKKSETRAVFPLKRARAGRYCDDRLVLVGDAAHSIHPLAGQGANIGLLDAACLSQVLLEARSKQKDIGSRNVLRKYERWRKGDNEIMMMIMEGFKYLFENQGEPLPVLRNTGMNLVDSNGPIKYWIMRRAMGLAGDLPDFARA